MDRAAEMRVILLDWGAPKPGAELKALDIYSSAAVVSFCPAGLLSLPPRLSTGWAQSRHPQTGQISHFRALYLFEEAIVEGFGSIVKAEKVSRSEIHNWRNEKNDIN